MSSCFANCCFLRFPSPLRSSYISFASFRSQNFSPCSALLIDRKGLDVLSSSIFSSNVFLPSRVLVSLSLSSSFDRWCVSFLSTDDTRFVSNRDGWIDRYFRLSSMVEILCERKDGKLIVNAINHLLPPPLSLSFSLLHLSHTFITRIDFSLLFLIFPTLSYSHSPSFFLLFSSLGFCSLFSHADISYLVRILDRHLIYGDTYIQKEYQKNKYICKYIYVYI